VGASLFGQNEADEQAQAKAEEMERLSSLLSHGFQQSHGALTGGLLTGAGVTDRRSAAQRGMEQQINAIKHARTTGFGGGGERIAQELMGQWGITDADITAYDAANRREFDPNYNPYQSLLDNAYSQKQIDARAKALYDPASLDGQLNNMEAASRMNFEGAARSAEADASRRGVLQGSGAASAINQIRVGQAATNTSEHNNLVGGLAQEERGYRVNQMDTGNALMARGIDQARQNLVGTYGLLSNGVDRGIGIMGGLQNMYASDAAGQAQGLQQMLGSLAATGTLADLFKKKPTVGTPPINPMGGRVPTYNPMGAAGTVNPLQSVLGRIP
jgi:hypothetical protein